MDKSIAIIGSGISGLGAAYMLAPHHNITVHEKNDYIGGHARTIDVITPEGPVPVDTGFIVCNYRNYPLLTALFSHLNVPLEKSKMSFGATIKDGWLDYSTQSLGSIFAQKANFIRPHFWRMLADILKFNAQAGRYIQSGSSVTLGQCLDELKMGEWFRKYYLLAMGGAIWSTPVSGMLDFPAATFVRFFDNHGLLTINNQPQWYTVKGGSRAYIKRLTEAFSNRIWLNCGATKISRNDNGITVHDTKGEALHYDAVIFACHADQALKLIENPTRNEQTILAGMRYQPNRMVLHSDTSFMPKRTNAWASWIYLSESAQDHSTQMCLSYWMNNLQGLKTKRPIIVTLNPTREPNQQLVYDEYLFDHPVFDKSAIQAQSQLDLIQGQDRFWFCGAYQRYGFHEDGLLSAFNIAQKMGIKPPWI